MQFNRLFPTDSFKSWLVGNQSNGFHWPHTTEMQMHCVLSHFWWSASSPQGKTFSIWKLNDLHNLEVFVSLLLFGEVHKEHWKTEPGTVIGLLNPNPMKQKEGYDGVSGQSELNTMYIQQSVFWQQKPVFTFITFTLMQSFYSCQCQEPQVTSTNQKSHFNADLNLLEHCWFYK